MEKNRISMQVSIPEELIEEFGGIYEVLNKGVDKRYNDLDCEFEECVLCSLSQFADTIYEEEGQEDRLKKIAKAYGCSEDVILKAGYLTGIGNKWWNVEFECDVRDLHIDPDQFDDSVSCCGFYVKKVKPEWITAAFLIEWNDEERLVLHNEIIIGEEVRMKRMKKGVKSTMNCKGVWDEIRRIKAKGVDTSKLEEEFDRFEQGWVEHVVDWHSADTLWRDEEKVAAATIGNK